MAIPQNVVDALAQITAMLGALRALPASMANLTISIADTFNPIMAPAQAEEVGFLDWPNADFKTSEIAWATLQKYMNLSGLAWKFPLRRKVGDAIKATEAMLTQARVLTNTTVLRQSGMPWGLFALVAGAWWYLKKKR